jgi:hypothetical protein
MAQGLWAPAFAGTTTPENAYSAAKIALAEAAHPRDKFGQDVTKTTTTIAI